MQNLKMIFDISIYILGIAWIQYFNFFDIGLQKLTLKRKHNKFQHLYTFYHQHTMTLYYFPAHPIHNHIRIKPLKILHNEFKTLLNSSNN